MDRYGHELNRLKPIFLQAAASFAQTIRPNDKNREIIAALHTEFNAWLTARPWHARADRYLGVHVRRGDRFGSSWAYHNQHLPIALYAQAIRKTWSRPPQAPAETPSSTNKAASAKQQPVVYLACDDPAVHEELEENLGSGIVFSLARSEAPMLRDLASPRAYVQAQFDALSDEQRIHQTRGMLADFAMISGMWTKPDTLAPEAVVCGMR